MISKERLRLCQPGDAVWDLTAGRAVILVRQHCDVVEVVDISPVFKMPDAFVTIYEIDTVPHGHNVWRSS